MSFQIMERTDTFLFAHQKAMLLRSKSYPFKNK